MGKLSLALASFLPLVFIFCFRVGVVLNLVLQAFAAVLG
jgi:hypothetical protein